jgi:RNA polymerase sigma-70 factor (ECF subfamily)
MGEEACSDDSMTETVTACQQGDRSAQRQLYEQCFQRVYALVMGMVGEQDAADVTQQVFLQAFRGIGNYRGSAKFQTWLHRVAVNESLQHLRRRRRWKAEPLADEPADEFREHDELAEQKDLLERALARLDPQLRSLFLLREVEGVPYRDIAETLHIPEGTVGSRLTRARQELQTHLKDLGWEP